MPDTLRKSWLHQKGHCVICAKKDAYTMAGRYLCADCTEKRSEYQIKYREENREVINERQNQKRRDRAESGLCRRCGQPAYEGTTFCWKHLIAHRLYRAKNREKNKTWKDDDICHWCSNPVVPGKKFCVDCLKRKSEIIEKARSNQDRKNHPWNKDTKAIFAAKNAITEDITQNDYYQAECRNH